jgi:hypothetical protein
VLKGKSAAAKVFTWNVKQFDTKQILINQSGFAETFISSELQREYTKYTSFNVMYCLNEKYISPNVVQNADKTEYLVATECNIE